MPSLTNAASLSPSVPVYACLGANGGRCRMRRIALPAMPPVGAGSSQREDSPTHRSLYAQTPHESPYGFSNDAARRVATLFEKWNLLIETSLRARGENLPNDPIPRPFAAVSLLEYGGLKPILPFPGGRSDAACTVCAWRRQGKAVINKDLGRGGAEQRECPP